MSTQPKQSEQAHGLLRQYISQQATIPVQAVSVPTPPTTPLSPEVAVPVVQTTIFPNKQRRVQRALALILTIAIALALFFTWRTLSPYATKPDTALSTQTFTTLAPKSTSSTHLTTSSTTVNSTTIQVYIVGAVKKPGIYTLPAAARVYQLVQAAGGPLPKANLVALNLAARLTDGQEVYVTLVGESPPSYSGGVPGVKTSTSTASNTQTRVNINTASAEEMRQELHVSATTAQNIMNYRSEHGPFTAIEQLLQVVSKSIYNKIQSQVTLS